MRALLSVTDKTGIVDFARGLVKLGFELVSTGGTAQLLRNEGLAVLDVAEVTGFQEMLDGRVKTLHPMVHGGLLGDVGNESHRHQMEVADIQPIQLLCVNLYAFEATVSKPHVFEDAIESIDIGGPAMIRAASKNFKNVTVVVDPADYASVLENLANGATDRRQLAAKAFRHTAFYDSMISRYLSDESFPETLTIGLRRKATLRYGENPHQTAALYQDPLSKPGIAQADLLWGKELSYNNILDSDAAWELVCDLPEGACAIIKHGNPCGAAASASLGESYRIARATDPISAFGGIAAFNGLIDEDAALTMTEKGNFLEVVIGTGFSPEALEVFSRRAGWGQDVRLLSAPTPPDTASMVIRTLRGGALFSQTDEEPQRDWRVVTEKEPTANQMEALRFQWIVAQHVKSNAIVIGLRDRILGVGAGQMNRVQSVRLALEQAKEGAYGAALASDAFFPFPDSIETAAKAGVSAVIQPGGSKKDHDVIRAANELGLAMVFTGVRHFRH